MKVDQATVSVHRAALLDAAGRLFRGRGLDRVSVAEVGRAAGLTHGAVYSHYGSKDALAEAACRRELTEAVARWRARAASTPADRIGAIIDQYLTEQHRDDPGGGCVLSSLGPEAARGGGGVGAALGDGAEGLLAVLTEELGRADASLAPQPAGQVALAMLALLSGAIILARALRADPARSADALSAARQAARLLAHSRPVHPPAASPQ